MLEQFNSQHQPMIEWEPSFNVAGAYFDQAVRSGELSGKTMNKVAKHLEKAEKLGGGDSAVDQLENAIRQLDDTGDQGELRQALIDVAESLG